MGRPAATEPDPTRAVVLVVEDEALIALDIEATLRRGGFEVLGPAASVGDAARLTAGVAVDAAVLDVNLGQEQVFPVADALAARDVPFVFLTGYGRAILPARHRDRPVAIKPCRAETIVRLVEGALSAR
jgi:CheY-like chemotaxis protein